MATITTSLTANTKMALSNPTRHALTNGGDGVRRGVLVQERQTGRAKTSRAPMNRFTNPVMSVKIHFTVKLTTGRPKLEATGCLVHATSGLPMPCQILTTRVFCKPLRLSLAFYLPSFFEPEAMFRLLFLLGIPLLSAGRSTLMKSRKFAYIPDDYTLAMCR